MSTSEIKIARFKRVAERRTKKILVLLKLLGRCSNKAAYTYTDEDVKKIFDALEAATANTKQMFILKDVDFTL